MRFYRWEPQSVWELTGSELLWWTEQANTMVAREAEAIREQQRRR